MLKKLLILTLALSFPLNLRCYTLKETLEKNKKGMSLRGETKKKPIPTCEKLKYSLYGGLTVMGCTAGVVASGVLILKSIEWYITP